MILENNPNQVSKTEQQLVEINDLIIQIEEKIGIGLISICQSEETNCEKVETKLQKSLNLIIRSLSLLRDRISL